MNLSQPAPSHVSHEVYAHDRDSFWLSLFVPQAQREGLLALYALNIELKNVHNATSEEMIGHIRYAWWQEALDGLYAGKVPRGHPVLEMLMRVVDAGHMPQMELELLIEAYRGAYPQLPSDIEELMEKISVVYIRLTCPGAEQGWRKAHVVIARHRRKYGKKRSRLLALKLLIAGR